MRISLSVWNMHPAELVRLAPVAEQAGFHGLWLGEHVLAPVHMDSHHPTSGESAHQHHADRPIVALDTELVDPLVALAGAAAATSRLHLATGVFVLPLRPPLLAARAAITLQQVAGGRFRLGVGAGWLEEEFAAVGAPFRGRGARLEECLEVLRLATAGGPFEFHGDHVDVPLVQLTAEPVDVPVVFGGSSPRALRRAGELARGWFASGTPDVDEVASHRAEILEHHAAAGRDDSIEFVVRSPSTDPDLLADYGRAGFDEVVVWADQCWVGDSVEERTDALLDAGRALGLTPQQGARA